MPPPANQRINARRKPPAMTPRPQWQARDWQIDPVSMKSKVAALGRQAIAAGDSAPLGATVRPGGVNFKRGLRFDSDKVLPLEQSNSRVEAGDANQETARAKG